MATRRHFVIVDWVFYHQKGWCRVHRVFVALLFYFVDDETEDIIERF